MANRLCSWPQSIGSSVPIKSHRRSFLFPLLLSPPVLLLFIPWLCESEVSDVMFGLLEAVCLRAPVEEMNAITLQKTWRRWLSLCGNMKISWVSFSRGAKDSCRLWYPFALLQISVRCAADELHGLPGPDERRADGLRPRRPRRADRLARHRRRQPQRRLPTHRDLQGQVDSINSIVG